MFEFIEQFVRINSLNVDLILNRDKMTNKKCSKLANTLRKKYITTSNILTVSRSIAHLSNSAIVVFFLLFMLLTLQQIYHLTVITSSGQISTHFIHRVHKEG